MWSWHSVFIDWCMLPWIWRFLPLWATTTFVCCSTEKNKKLSSVIPSSFAWWNQMFYCKFQISWHHADANVHVVSTWTGFDMWCELEVILFFKGVHCSQMTCPSPGSPHASYPCNTTLYSGPCSHLVKSPDLTLLSCTSYMEPLLHVMWYLLSLQL